MWIIMHGNNLLVKLMLLFFWSNICIDIYMLNLCIFSLLTESPRWLITNGKLKKAEKVIRHIAAINKKTVPDDLMDKIKLIKEEEATMVERKCGVDCMMTGTKTVYGKLKALFRTPTMRKRITIVSFHWYVSLFSIHVLAFQLFLMLPTKNTTLRMSF